MEDILYVVAGAAISGFAVAYAGIQRIQYNNRISELSNLSTINKDYALSDAKNGSKADSILEKIFCLGDILASKKFLKTKTVV